MARLFLVMLLIAISVTAFRNFPWRKGEKRLVKHFLKELIIAIIIAVVVGVIIISINI